MPFNVTMPDGTVVQNVPDGTTKTQLMARYQKATPAPTAVQPQKQAQEIQSTPNVPQQKQSITPAPVAAQEPGKQPGFMERVGQDLTKRGQMAQEIGQATKSGQQTMGEGMLQATGKVGAGAVGDVIGEAAKSAYGALPENIREKVSGGVQKAMATPLGQAGIAAAKKGALEYVNWAKDNPRAARNIESVVDIASVIPQARAAGSVAGAAGKIVGETAALAAKPIPIVGRVVKGVRTPEVDAIKSEAATMGKKASGDITKVREMGVSIDPKVGVDLSKNLDTSLDMKNDVKVGAAPLAAKAIQNLKNVISKGDTSFDTFVVARNELTDAMKRGGEERIAASEARDHLDNAMASSKVDKKYRAAMDEYAMSKRYGNVVEGLAKGRGSSNKIKAQMNKIIDGGELRYYPENIQNMIRRVAKGRTSQNILEYADSLANALPFVGKLTGITIGSVADWAAGKIAKGDVVDILKKIKK